MGISVNINLGTAGADEYSSSSRKDGAKNNIRAQEILVGSAGLGCLLPVSHEQDAAGGGCFSEKATQKSGNVLINIQNGIAESTETSVTFLPYQWM